eukprot:12406814-Prorocentrum_lima.AAC.1
MCIRDRERCGVSWLDGVVGLGFDGVRMWRLVCPLRWAAAFVFEFLFVVLLGNGASFVIEADSGHVVDTICGLQLRKG